jgi:hypothetical protein
MKVSFHFENQRSLFVQGCLIVFLTFFMTCFIKWFVYLRTCLNHYLDNYDSKNCSEKLSCKQALQERFEFSTNKIHKTYHNLLLSTLGTFGNFGFCSLGSRYHSDSSFLVHTDLQSHQQPPAVYTSLVATICYFRNLWKLSGTFGNILRKNMSQQF